MNARTLTLSLAGAGVCSAAGGWQASLDFLAGQGDAAGPELLDAYDLAGDPIAAVPALASQALAPAERFQALLAAAIADLPQPPAPGERLFVISPESGDDFTAQVLMQVVAGQFGSARARSCHAGAFEALRAACACLAGGAPEVLVLACESWLNPEALARLDDQDQLLGPSSEGVLPGEAAVLLRLAPAGVRLHCALALDAQDRASNLRPLGTSISEALLTLPGGNTGAATTVFSDQHAGHRAFSREAEFLRRRHWAHLAPEGAGWRDAAGLGYIGHALPLLQLAALAGLPSVALPAIACARSLSRHAVLGARELESS